MYVIYKLKGDNSKMKLDLKTTITAYPKISPSLLAGYVKEVDQSPEGVTWARQYGKWVQIRPAEIKFLYGTTDTLSITSAYLENFKSVPNLKYQDQSIDIEVETAKPGVNGAVGGSIVWFCASVPISLITQTDIGKWPIDYIPQIGVITMPDNTQYYCYRTTTPLLPNRWKFTVTFDVDVAEGGSCK